MSQLKSHLSEVKSENERMTSQVTDLEGKKLELEKNLEDTQVAKSSLEKDLKSVQEVLSQTKDNNAKVSKFTLFKKQYIPARKYYLNIKTWKLKCHLMLIGTRENEGDPTTAD